MCAADKPNASCGWLKNGYHSVLVVNDNQTDNDLTAVSVMAAGSSHAHRPAQLGHEHDVAAQLEKVGEKKMPTDG